LRDAKPKLEQFAVDTRRTPELVLRAHLPDQRAQFYLDLWAPSPRARFPAPITAKAGPMPTHERFRLDNRHDLQDRGKPAIHLNEEPAIVVGKLGSTPHLAPQNDQLMSKYEFSASSLLFESNGEASTARTNQISAIIAPV
jgi:hypothetical protein